MGVFRYGRMGGYHAGEKRVLREKDTLLALDVPPIVSPEIWEAAQARRAHNKRISGTKHYLLRGLVNCGCGRKMSGTLSKREKPYYRCNSNNVFVRGIEDDRADCHAKTINANALETAVWGYVLDILTDPVSFEAGWRKAQQAEQEVLAPKQSRLEVVNELIAHCEQEATDTAEALKHARGTSASTI